MTPFKLSHDLVPHARSLARGVRIQSAWMAGGTLAIAVLLLLWLEGIRYLSPAVKTTLLITGIILILLIILGITLYTLALQRQGLSRSQDRALAEALGRKHPDIGDRLLNAVQLGQRAAENGISEPFRQLAVSRARDALATIDLNTLYPTREIRRIQRRSTFILGIVLLLMLVTYPMSLPALQRLVHPRQVYPYPMPVTLSLNVTDSSLLAGDTVRVEGQVRGRQPRRVTLIQTTERDTTFYALSVKDGRFDIEFPNLRRSMTLQALVENGCFWEPWRIQRSSSQEIKVINRPVIQDLTVTLHPPAYSRLPIEVQRRDILDITGLKGSRVVLDGLISKEVEQGELRFASGSTRPLKLKGPRFQVSFNIDQQDVVSLYVVDDEGIANLRPLEYPVYLIRDVPPLVKITTPAQDVVLGESLRLPLVFKLDDDYGFSRLELNYQVEHPDYLMADTTIQSQPLDLPPRAPTTLEMDYFWDLDAIGLMPEDAVTYWITVWDNNEVDGPQMGVSRRWTARFPSLTEMFEEMDRSHAEAREQTEDVLEVVQDIKEKIDELALEVKKDPNLDWEQQQEASQAMAEMADLQEQLEAISEELDKMLENAEQQNLFSEETLEKYSELQQLMSELITPEMMEAMQRLQEAMQEQDPQQMARALEDFQSSMEDFERSVERTLEIFKQIELEQTIDELAQRLEDLAQRQEELTESLSDMDQEQAKDAAALEERIQQDFETAQTVAEHLDDLLEQRPELDDAALEALQEAMDEAALDQQLEAAAEALEQGNISQAQPHSQQAQQSLQQMAQMAGMMQQGMQQQMMDQVMDEFREVILKTLALSQAQESLEGQTNNTPRHSSKLREHAQSQQDLQGGLRQIAGDLAKLGEKTFAVSTAMSRNLGKSLSEMQSAIQSMEDRNPRRAAQNQAASREHLNRMAQQLASAMQNLQQSGQSSGFQQYMQQLQQMAGSQQGLNEQTMMQMGSGSMSMMQQLAERQMQLRESLGRIEQGMGEDGRMLGDLGKIGEDMEAVARELNQRQPSKRVLQQQERILSRLLDAQRSAHQRDYSKKRKSRTGASQPGWQGVTGLPEDLGETRNLLYEEVLHSMRQGYSREEQALIRQYFENLEASLE